MTNIGKLPFAPKSISCSLEFNKDNQSVEIENDHVIETVNKFKSYAQHFVTVLEILWQYSRQIGSLAEKTSLYNLSCLPSFLDTLKKRAETKKENEQPIAYVLLNVNFDDPKETALKTKLPIYEEEHLLEFQDYYKYHNKALRLLYESVLQQLVNSWEKLLGELIAWKLETSPDLTSKDRNISISEILRFESIEAIKKFLIDQEVFQFIFSKTTNEQIKYFKTQFNIDFNSQFCHVGNLCEVVLRRHAIVHSGGIVTKDYLNRLARLRGTSVVPPKSGEQIPIDSDYIENAWNIFFSAGVILSHLVASKYAKNEKNKEAEDKADSFLINASFNLIKNSHFKTSKIILEYANKVKLAKSTTELMVKVNLAQTHKWLEEDILCKKLLDSVDWNSCSSNFRICIAALKEDVVRFKKELPLVVQEGSIKFSEFFDWPIFQKLRKMPEYQEIIEKAFGKKVTPKSDKIRKPKLLDISAYDGTEEAMKQVLISDYNIPENILTETKEKIEN
jgi:hypothetical protein